MELLKKEGYQIGNLDVTICLQQPKINPHIPAMKACLAEVMKVADDKLSLKATTTERLGFVGREEGVSAYCVALIHP